MLIDVLRAWGILFSPLPFASVTGKQMAQGTVRGLLGCVRIAGGGGQEWEVLAVGTVGVSPATHLPGDRHEVSEELDEARVRAFPGETNRRRPKRHEKEACFLWCRVRTNTG